MMVLETAAFRRPWGALAVCLMLASVPLASPARAEDDSSILNSVLSFVGMQPEKEKDIIDYRARAPLVVPPRTELPPPVPAGSGRTAQWPNDPDVMARRREAIDSRRPAPQFTNGRAELSKDELMRGRSGTPAADTRTSDCTAASSSPHCLYTPWDRLKDKVMGASDKDVVVSGEEPPRDYLTEPPKGYRRPTATTQVVNGPVKVAPDAGDAAAYARENGRHKVSVDD